MAMFGIIVSGRLVQTDFVQLSDNQFVSTIQDADNINHVVIFLTGVMALPEGMGAKVFFSWPDPNAPPHWQLLGHIANNKPSAIFKISSLKKLHEMGDNLYNTAFGQQAICHNAQVGVSVEPIVNIQDPQPDDASKYATFAQKMLENFMNYTLSFAMAPSNVMSPNVQYVPLSTIQTWYTNFERRLTQNPNFWKT